MELREAIKVLDSDAHARDSDAEIRQYLDEPYRNQKAAFIPGEHYDRNLGGTLGHSGVKHSERLAAIEQPDIYNSVDAPTDGFGISRVRCPRFTSRSFRAHNH